MIQKGQIHSAHMQFIGRSARLPIILFLSLLAFSNWSDCLAVEMDLSTRTKMTANLDERAQNLVKTLRNKSKDNRVADDFLNSIYVLAKLNTDFKTIVADEDKFYARFSQIKDAQLKIRSLIRNTEYINLLWQRRKAELQFLNSLDTNKESGLVVYQHMIVRYFVNILKLLNENGFAHEYEEKIPREIRKKIRYEWNLLEATKDKERWEMKNEAKDNAFYNTYDDAQVELHSFSVKSGLKDFKREHKISVFNLAKPDQIEATKFGIKKFECLNLINSYENSLYSFVNRYRMIDDFLDYLETIDKFDPVIAYEKFVTIQNMWLDINEHQTRPR